MKSCTVERLTVKPVGILGDSKGKVNVLEGDSIGHYKGEKVSYGHVSNSEWLPRHSCLNLQIKKHCEW
jgi:hypothetical protein